jgi:hypothetical protein
MLDIEQSRRARKYSSTEMIRQVAMDPHATPFSVYSEALFRVPAISSALA